MDKAQRQRPTNPDSGQVRASSIAAVMNERAYQDAKWGSVSFHPHEVGGRLTILRSELREAEEEWAHSGSDDALAEIVQIAAIAVACLDQHGIGSYGTTANERI